MTSLLPVKLALTLGPELCEGSDVSAVLDDLGKHSETRHPLGVICPPPRAKLAKGIDDLSGHLSRRRRVMLLDWVMPVELGVQPRLDRMVGSPDRQVLTIASSSRPIVPGKGSLASTSVSAPPGKMKMFLNQ
jgi:hypothetical protein